VCLLGIAFSPEVMGPSAMPVTSTMPIESAEAELRRRSLAILARSFAGIGAEEEAGRLPPPKRRAAAVSAESGSCGQTNAAHNDGALPSLTQLRGELAAARDAGADGVCAEKIAVVLDVLTQLQRRQVTCVELKDSEIGREVNQRYWRDHPNSRVNVGCRQLVLKWRALVAERKAGADGAGGGAKDPRTGVADAIPGPCTATGGAPPNVVDRGAGYGVVEGAPDAWDAAWSEVAAARCAQDVEAAAWACPMVDVELPCGAGSDVLDGERLRAYKAKVRFLAAALRRPENSVLRQRALDGTVTGGELVGRPAEDFLSEAQIAERKRDRDEGMRSVVLQEAPLMFFDQRLVCPKCSAVGANYRVLRDSWALPRCTGNQGHMRRDTGKCILAECPACRERWQQDGVV